MKRREFIALLGGAAAPAFPLAARARNSGRTKIPRIGIIDDGPIWEPFRQALREAGYVEGQTIAFEYRRADGNPERLAAAAAELARLPVDVIATYGTPASRAAKAATSTIPIVMISVGDPVRAGLVQSLARPGGNVTGNTILSPDLGPKRLQLVKEIIPSAARVALLWNPDNVSNAVILEQMRDAAPGAGPCVHRGRGAQRGRFRRRVRHTGARAARCRAADQRSDASQPTCRGSSTSCRRTGCRECSRPGTTPRPAG